MPGTGRWRPPAAGPAWRRSRCPGRGESENLLAASCWWRSPALVSPARAAANLLAPGVGGIRATPASGAASHHRHLETASVVVRRCSWRLGAGSLPFCRTRPGCPLRQRAVGRSLNGERRAGRRPKPGSRQCRSGAKPTGARWRRAGCRRSAGPASARPGGLLGKRLFNASRPLRPCRSHERLKAPSKVRRSSNALGKHTHCQHAGSQNQPGQKGGAEQATSRPVVRSSADDGAAAGRASAT